LLVQRDTHAGFGMRLLSSGIVIDFDGDLASILVPAALTYVLS